jgi:hypothetical protein
MVEGKGGGRCGSCELGWAGGLRGEKAQGSCPIKGGRLAVLMLMAAHATISLPCGCVVWEGWRCQALTGSCLRWDGLCLCGKGGRQQRVGHCREDEGVRPKGRKRMGSRQKESATRRF